MIDVVIVGAGAAGLMCARELARAGQQVLVLEASHRVGGRVLTLLETHAGVPIELGAEFIHGDAPVTTRLLDEARLATLRVSGEHVRSDRGELAPQGPIWKRMSRVFALMSAERRNDRSFQEFLDDRPGGARLARERELARGFVQGFNGADPSLVSEKALAEQGDPTEGAADARRIVDGYATLIIHLEREVAGLVQLQSVVERIEWNEAGVRVVARDGTAHAARAAVITLPLPMLQDGTVRLDPDVPTLTRVASRLVMGHVARVNVVLRERFWETKVDALGYVHTPERPFTVWWTQHPVQAPLLVGWAGGPPALELTLSGTVEETVLAELAHSFGLRRARAESLVESILWHDWSSDPLARGAYSYVGVGGSSASRTLARPIENRVFLAGEATSESSGGTVEGALASGQRAARQVLKALGA
ncbi:MAG TPA: NAD(P)/FAD-dependent oxidoreductase, partial [Gemmatimonadaceae bacterium]|nr:NAD(P)/FAD-dependent oxidoreductase [Gemmatimonadaceae bacterium]